MDAFKRLEDLRQKEFDAREKAFRISEPYIRKILELEAEIEHLKKEQTEATYKAWGEVHSIRCLITEIHQQELQARREKYLNEQ